jgi:hypothetical protein
MMIAFIMPCNFLNFKKTIVLSHFCQTVIKRMNTLAVMIINYLTELTLMIADQNTNLSINIGYIIIINMKIGVIGSRNFRNLDRVRFEVQSLILKYPGCEIISGGAKGVDKTAERACKDFEHKATIFPPDFSKGIPACYHIRNDQIIEASDKIIAFYNGYSPGTKSVINKCLERRKHIEVIFDEPVTLF